jgi:hypothetical protein
MIAVSPNRYLDLRSPAWAPLEQREEIRFEEGVVIVRPEGPVTDMLRVQAPELTLAEVSVLRRAWQRRRA